MIIREFYLTREDGINLYRIYSDEDFEIQKVGTNEIYSESIDVEDAGFEYVETRNKIAFRNEMLDIEDKDLTETEIATMLEEIF